MSKSGACEMVPGWEGERRWGYRGQLIKPMTNSNDRHEKWIEMGKCMITDDFLLFWDRFLDWISINRRSKFRLSIIFDVEFFFGHISSASYYLNIKDEALRRPKVNSYA